MNNRIKMYPYLNENHLENIKFESNERYRFSYKDLQDKTIKKLNVEYEINDNDILILDKNSTWSSTINNLIVERMIKFNPKDLFGLGGIVSLDAKLGLGIRWNSRNSMLRGSKKIFTFDRNSSNIEEEIYFEIRKKTYSKDVTLEVVLYVEERDPNEVRAKNFANEEGLIVGVLDTNKFIIDGIGSQFTITEINSKSKPLWELGLHWVNLEEDASDSINLSLNKAHKDYPLITADNPNYNQHLVDEIMINIVFQIILKAQKNNDFEELEDNHDVGIGSVGALLLYYKNTYNIIEADPEVLYSKISKGVRP